ncbi:MAG: NYN domain-containing protein [Patescibacteria group bacterium]
MSTDQPAAAASIVHVFIDASNLWQAQKAKGRLLNYGQVVEHIKDRFSASKIKVFYYSAFPGEGTRDYDLSSKHRFFTFLKKGLGFAVIKKELKRIRVTEGESESIIEKGNMDVEIAIDALHHISKYDTAAFFTGDADFLALVSYLRRHGKRVFVFSSRNNISQELRTGSDGYVDILDLPDDIWGNVLQHRRSRAA